MTHGLDGQVNTGWQQVAYGFVGRGNFGGMPDKKKGSTQ